jgi:hypothetical protein
MFQYSYSGSEHPTFSQRVKKQPEGPLRLEWKTYSKRDHVVYSNVEHGNLLIGLQSNTTVRKSSVRRGEGDLTRKFYVLGTYLIDITSG